MATTIERNCTMGSLFRNAAACYGYRPAIIPGNLRAPGGFPPDTLCRYFFTGSQRKPK